MWTRIALAVAVACIATSGVAAPHHRAKGGQTRNDLPTPCDMRNLAACPDTNHLVWTPAFERAVHAFLGRRPATYLGVNDTIADEFIRVMSGPPNPPERIGDLFRFTACEAHACPDKAAAVLTSDGRLLAVARLTSRCTIQEMEKDDESCLGDMRLVIFMSPQEKRQAIVDDLSKWAKSEIAQAYHHPALPAERLVRVDVIPVVKQQAQHR